MKTVGSIVVRILPPVLIVVPVVVLSILGGLFIRGQTKLAQQEVRDDAERAAAVLLDRIEPEVERLIASPGHFVLTFDELRNPGDLSKFDIGLQTLIREKGAALLATGSESAEWIAFRKSGSEIAIVHTVSLRSAIEKTIADAAELIPESVSAAVRIEGHRISSAAGKQIGIATGDRVSVAIFSRNPEAQLAMVDRQITAMKALLALTILAAFIGVISTMRAISRQRSLNQQQNDFVASVSHELRTPIAAMQLVTGRLREGKVDKDPEKRQTYFELIHRETRRLAGLVENVLDYARISQNRQEWNFQETDLAALVEKTIEAIEPLATEKAITLHAKVEPLPESPLLDGGEIQQALSNLLDNAIKYSPHDTTVTVRLAPISDAAFAIEVLDAGSGIPPADHERVFERFFRRGEELRRTTTGAGIGLSLVRHIAEAHGGTARVESDGKSGSRFILTLPYSHE